jgi:hypothetical protein
MSSSMGYLNDLSVAKLIDPDLIGLTPVDLHNLQMVSIRDMSPSRPQKRKYAIINLSLIDPCSEDGHQAKILCE